MNYYLGLDVGGTNLAAGIVDENYHVVAKAVLPAGAGRSIEEITEDMIRVCAMAAEKAGHSLEDFPVIGIGMPSYVNPNTQLLVHANCFGWRNVPIFTHLEKSFHGQIYIENDANCAALGEVLAGNAKGCRNVIMLTLGTGVGSGIILDGKIYAGADLMGAELGHTKLIYKGKRCTCGQLGCADSYCSARGLTQQARDALSTGKKSLMTELCGGSLKKMDARIVFEAAQRGDATAKEVLEQYIDYLVAAMSTFTTIFRPELFILGGGVANAGKALTEPLQKSLLVNTFAGAEIGVPKIKLAGCGDDAGIIGAAFLQKYGMDRRNINIKKQEDRYEF